jgi:acetolactate synthase-1/2/3 large subunit
MNFGELFSIGRSQIPIKILLLNNKGDGMVRNIQDVLYDSNYVGTLKHSSVNYANVAREFGFPFHRRVEHREELKKSLEDLLSAEGPAFLEVVCDVDEVVYPRIPAGSGYQDMVLGPYMEKTA